MKFHDFVFFTYTLPPLIGNPGFVSASWCVVSFQKITISARKFWRGMGWGCTCFTMLTHWMKQDEMLIYLLQKSHWLGIVVKELWGWICKNAWCCMRYSHIDIIIRKWGAFYGTSRFCFRRVTTARHSQGTKSDLSQPI